MSFTDMAGAKVDVARGRDWSDEEIDRLFARTCVVLKSRGVSAARIAARLRVHRATVYRWVGQVPPDERRRLERA